MKQLLLSSLTSWGDDLHFKDTRADMRSPVFLLDTLGAFKGNPEGSELVNIPPDDLHVQSRNTSLKDGGEVMSWCSAISVFPKESERVEEEEVSLGRMQLCWFRVCSAARFHHQTGSFSAPHYSLIPDHDSWLIATRHTVCQVINRLKRCRSEVLKRCLLHEKRELWNGVGSAAQKGSCKTIMTWCKDKITNSCC